MNAEWCDLPMCTCPHCGKEWQEDEYWRIEIGDTIECPHCEETMYVVGLDTTVTVTLSTEED